MPKTKSAEKFEFKAEMKQLLHLIIHSLYSHKEVFLRELISNASDAMNKARMMKLKKEKMFDADATLDIRIDFDEKANTFSIEDAGIGMSKEDLSNHLGTIAKSGTLEYMKHLKENGGKADDNLIGQFGVGFYSVFIVTDEVVVETRSADPDSTGWKWTSKGESDFTIEPIEKKTRGTKISFKLKDSAKEFAQDYAVKSVIEKYSNFADFPILVKGEQANKVEALWRKSKKDITESQYNEFYKFVANEANDPLSHLSVSVEGASASFKSLLFVPKTAPHDLFRVQEDGSVHLYSNKILIQRECKDLLPPYLRFMKGVIDTEDLPLNVSREHIQSSPATTKIRDILTKKILSHLEDWSSKKKDEYQEFFKNYGALLKAGLEQDFVNRDKLLDLIRFQTTKTKIGEYASLKEYVSRMKPDQKEIFYLAGNDRSSIEANPNLEYFKKNEIEVLLLCEPVDVFIIPSIPEYQKTALKSADKTDDKGDSESKIEKPDDKLQSSLIKLFKDTLGDKVEDVKISKRLVDSAASLVRGDGGMDPQMEKMMKMMKQDFKQSKKILEINLDHAVLSNLSTLHLGNVDKDLIEKCVWQIYDNALLAEGDFTAVKMPELVKRITELMETATKVNPDRAA